MPKYQFGSFSFFSIFLNGSTCQTCSWIQFSLKMHRLRRKKTQAHKLSHVTWHVKFFLLVFKKKYEIKRKSCSNPVGFAWSWCCGLLDNPLYISESHCWMKNVSYLPLKRSHFCLGVTSSRPASKLWHIPRATDFWGLCIRWLPPAPKGCLPANCGLFWKCILKKRGWCIRRGNVFWMQTHNT